MAQLTIEQALQTAVQQHQGGQFARAEQLYRQILAQQPDHAAALHLLGVLAQQRGQSGLAVELIRRAVTFQPNFPEAYNNLAVALKGIGQLDEAIRVLRDAVALNPSFAESHYNLGNALRANRQLDGAIAAFRQAIVLKPGFPEAHNNIGNALKDIGQIDEAIAAYRQAIALKPDLAEAHDNLLSTLHLHVAFDAIAIAAEHRRWNREQAEPLKKFIRPHANDHNPDRRLRIGYVSPDFREHPVGRFVLPILAHHDKSRFEVFAYAQVPVPDATTRHLRSHTDGWRTIAGLSDAQAADLIRDDQIDILVDLTMHAAGNRLSVFARKPAPVQVTYLSYCSTTGLETIDYRLSDPYLDPPGGDELVYTEQTIRLPQTYWCYQPMIEPRESGPPPALKRHGVTFGCLNNFCKVNEELLLAWAQILSALPDSQLLLHAHEGNHRQRVQERLNQAGIESQRVQFAGYMPTEKYFDHYRRIDIALDTFPCGGGTTTCDALWMGVPVVSLAGKTAVGRGGLSILSNLELPDLVARSTEAYVRIAIDLANDLPRRGNLRSTLRQRMERSPLMDGRGFAQNIESAYRLMWRKWCETN